MSNPIIEEININNKNLRDKYEMVYKIYEYFTNIGSILTNKIPCVSN